MAVKKKSLEELSDLSGISVVDFKTAIGIRLSVKCRARTVQGAYNDFRTSARWSEGHEAARRQWDRLALVRAKRARSLQSIRNALQTSRVGSEAHGVAQKKLEVFLMSKLVKARSADRALRIVGIPNTIGGAKKLTGHPVVDALLWHIKRINSLEIALRFVAYLPTRVDESVFLALEPVCYKRIYELYMAS